MPAEVIDGVLVRTITAGGNGLDKGSSGSWKPKYPSVKELSESTGSWGEGKKIEMM